MATEAVLLPGNFLFSISSKFLGMLVASVMARFLKYKFRTLGVKRMALTAQEIITLVKKFLALYFSFRCCTLSK